MTAARQPAVAGVSLALVGFASSFAVVLTGLRAVGATPAQAASGLLVLCLAQAVGMFVLARRYRIPVTLAWSTPGAALLAGAGGVAGDWAEAVGAFLVVGALIALTGLWPLLGRLVAAVPATIGQAMLAGVLFSLCLAPFRALEDDPVRTLVVAAVWLGVLRWRPLWASPATFAVALVLVAVATDWTAVSPRELLPAVDLVVPVFSPAALLGIAVPLYLVTMASQNVPGAAVLSSYGFRPPWRASLAVTGVGTMASSLAGGHAVNLAAITASLAASEDAHPDPAQRWRSSVAAAWAYVVLAPLSAALAVLVDGDALVLLAAVAGLALVTTLGSSMAAATADVRDRVPAVATFLCAASGLTVLGVGAAFWALLVGLLLRFVMQPAREGARA